MSEYTAELSINEHKKRTVHYLNNVEFKQALSDYKKLKAEMLPEVPQVPEYIGKCFIDIANGVARRPNFNGYSWREEMVGDAIETCLKNIDKFDVERGTSALAYFSQISWFCFLGRIAIEKKQSNIKRALVRHVDVDTFSLQAHDEAGDFTLNLQEFLIGIADKDDTPVHTPPPKKEKPGALEGFM